MAISQFKIAIKNDDELMKIALVGLFVAALSIDMQVTRIWGFILAFNCIRQKTNMIETPGCKLELVLLVKINPTLGSS